MSEDIQKKVIELISYQFGINSNAITPNDSIEDDLGADSLDMIELVIFAEQDFSIEISDEDAEKVVTVQDAIELVHRLVYE